MITVGEKLQLMRLSLGLNQTEMTNKVISRSFYSRVENNKSNVNIEDLLAILNIQGISVIDFFADFVNNHSHKYLFQERITSSFNINDIDGLKQIKADPNLTDIRIKQILEYMINKLIGNVSVPSVVKNNLKHDILQFDKWDEESLWIFSNVMDLYNFSELQGMVNSIFNHYKKSKMCEEYSLQLIALIAVQYLHLCSKQGNAVLEIKKTCNYLEKLPYVNKIFLFKLIGSYYKAMSNGDNESADNILQLVKDCGYIIEVGI